MKIVYDYINCKGKEFSDKEYEALRNEAKMRTELPQTHGYTLASITLVFFAAIFAFCEDLYSIVSSEGSIVGRYIVIDCLFAFAIIIFCGLPTLLIHPFSVKFHDNIRQIVSIAAYCRVFYEYPTMIKNSDPNTEKPQNRDTGVKSWELLHCNSVIPHGNWFAFEFYIISWASIFLSFIFGTILFGCIFGMPHEYSNTPGNIVIGAAFVLLSLAYFVGLFLIKHRCHKNVKIGKLFEVYEEVYFNAYAEEAVAIEFFTEEQAKELAQYREYMQDRDRKLADVIKKRM